MEVETEIGRIGSISSVASVVNAPPFVECSRRYVIPVNVRTAAMSTVVIDSSTMESNFTSSPLSVAIGSRVSTGVAVMVAATTGTAKLVVDCVQNSRGNRPPLYKQAICISSFPMVYAFASIVVNDKYKKNVSDEQPLFHLFFESCSASVLCVVSLF